MNCAETCSTCGLLRTAALHVAGTEGIDELSLRRLCEWSGLSDDQVRDHYATPAACLYATYEEFAAELLTDFSEAFASSATWDDGLALGMSGMLTKLAERPAAARFAFVEALRGDRELLRRREHARRAVLNLFVTEHRRRGEFEELHEIQLELLIGAVFQLVGARIADGRIDELPALRDELLERAGMFEPVPA